MSRDEFLKKYYEIVGITLKEDEMHDMVED